MLPIIRSSILLASCIATVTHANVRPAGDMNIIGTVENVAVPDIDMVMPARIDTGASMTSVHADILEIRKGTNGAPDKVVFRVSDHRGNEKLLEKPIERWVLIKKKNNEGSLRRPVVMMEFCLGGQQLEGHTNLANRERFKYPLLIGRNVLASGDYLVSASREFASAGSCSKPEA